MKAPKSIPQQNEQINTENNDPKAFKKAKRKQNINPDTTTIISDKANELLNEFSIYQEESTTIQANPPDVSDVTVKKSG